MQIPKKSESFLYLLPIDVTEIMFNYIYKDWISRTIFKDYDGKTLDANTLTNLFHIRSNVWFRKQVSKLPKDILSMIDDYIYQDIRKQHLPRWTRAIEKVHWGYNRDDVMYCYYMSNEGLLGKCANVRNSLDRLTDCSDERFQIHHEVGGYLDWHLLFEGICESCTGRYLCKKHIERGEEECTNECYHAMDHDYLHTLTR